MEVKTKLRAEKLSCGYGKKVVLSEICFEVLAGEFFCILGPNGVGKSTLFKTILGFLPRKGGKFLVDDRDILDFKREQLARVIAYVPQAHIPPFPFSVQDVVLMGRTACFENSRSPKQVDRDRVEEILESMGIAPLKSRVYTEISGGERQMVLIARALAQEPKFLVMDEPASNLDYGNQMRVLEQIMKLKSSGIGIIMASHYPDHAFLCSSNVILIEGNGEIRSGYCDDILTEETLSGAYGIPVRILEEADEDGVLKSCAMKFQ
ncbi:MAG: ABC transporter ATP-binding protein [Syntrophomonas sp.]